MLLLLEIPVLNEHLMQAVLEAHNTVIKAMKPGVNWVDMHK